MSDQAVYLFALCRTGVSHSFLREGMQRPENGDAIESLGEPVVVDCTDRLSAVVSTVDREAWTGDEAASNMRSLAWVAPRATRHEEVVEAVMETGPVYPARFGTLFSSSARLRVVAKEHEDVVCNHLDHVDGAQEWAVKLMLDRDRAVQQMSGDEEPTSGTAYLRQKVQEREARNEVDAWLDEVTDAVFDTLTLLSRDAVMIEARDRPDDSREVAAHAAFLVSNDNTDAFFQAVDSARSRLADNGLDVECTGPWPPYSFRPSLEDTQVK